ncbi:hypothetical protein GCM10022207_73570 [Streptomyces lannensis]|uniref:Uncharacterized protein n=1 Tax=Streptomyces lannensis TaxID=766498 RepID=A0ABP7L4B7_9ACTN
MILGRASGGLGLGSSPVHPDHAELVDEVIDRYGHRPWRVGEGDASARDATGAVSRGHAQTVARLGAPGHPAARGPYYSVGFREFTRDAPLVKTRAGG